MISASYGPPLCGKCHLNGYAVGTKIAPEYHDSWVYFWVHGWSRRDTGSISFVSACEGCHNVALERFRVIAVLLYKLGIRI